MTHHLGTSPTPHALLEFVLHHLQVKVNVCTFTVVDHGYELPRRTVPDWNLIVNHQGKLVWVIDNQAHHMNKGDLVVVPPGVAHHAYSLTKKAQILSIHIQPLLPDSQDAFAILTPPRFIAAMRGSRLSDYFRGAVSEWQHFGNDAGSLCRLYQAGWARLIVLELLREYCQPEPDQLTIDPLILDILKLLESNTTQLLTLPQLAGQVGYSAQHVNRLFRRVLGVTPLQYHRKLKMEKACQLLIQSALSVQGVGQAVGVDDPAYFSRLFRQHTGQSPAEYRQSSEHVLQDHT